MNKSVKFLAISLLLVPAFSRANDNASVAQGLFANIIAGTESAARELGTGFVGGVAGGASAAVLGKLSASYMQNQLKKDVAGAFVVLGSAKSVDCVTRLTEKQLGITNTNKTTFEWLANFVGNGAGWLTAQVLVAGIIDEAQKRTKNS